MQKFKLPVMLPPGVQAQITQPFGATLNYLEPRGPHGEPHFHYGVDLVFGNPMQTYGTPIVCPFDNATLTGYLENSQQGTATPFIQLTGKGVGGTAYTIVLAHPGTIAFQHEYNAGTIVGTVGNYGMVAPQPTIANPFGGSHLHLGCIINGEWVDPLDYFDINDPFVGPPHDASADVPRIEWAIEQLQAQIAKLLANRQP